MNLVLASFSFGNSGSETQYLEEIRRFPMLEPQEEFMLAKRWREHGDRDAARPISRFCEQSRKCLDVENL
jgi:DNA-directed RNA polymerase sigma subunit (sigma70/sigma32)